MDKKTVVALGVFDGVHSGHRTVINEAVSFKEKGFLPVAFTFKTPSVFKKGEKLQAILSDSIKAERLLRLGCEAVISPDFNELKNLSPEDFVKEILVEKLKAGVVVCGDDFRFGKNAQGNCETLKELGKKLDFEVKVVEPFMVSGEVLSSTMLRELIKNGEISKANRLLCENYELELEVVYGAQIGRTWNFPTINQIFPEGQVVVKFGVYCSRVLIDGVWYNGVTNVGVKPTVNEKSEPLAETFIMDYTGDLYGKKLRLSLYEFIREEKKFQSLDELKEEIAKNKKYAEKYFENIKQKG
ncbi:MAG: bifunctional riboflavin kinase/FAD synthetase [Ruminococcus sp.]|nr:bifunctional riboflavin kinase/FAD synthetase [Ruminococcus sp.]